jgi:hypothetical protein
MRAAVTSYGAMEVDDPIVHFLMLEELRTIVAGTRDTLRAVDVLAARAGDQHGSVAEGVSAVQETTGTGQLPRSNGGWDGEPGNSDWVSYDLDVVRITGGEPIRYVNSEPVLLPYAEERVLLRRMTGRNTPDFRAARDGLMRQYPGRWRNVTHVEQWEGGGVNDLFGASLAEQHTWHHEPDVEWMTLVPTELHGNLPHAGGASAARAGGTPDRPQAGPVTVIPQP